MEGQEKTQGRTNCTKRNKQICREIDVFRRDGLRVPEAIAVVAVRFHLAPDTIREIYYHK